MRAIGEIKQVQVQRSKLKIGQKPSRRYDPTPITLVARLLLTPQGVIGLIQDNEHIVDVHHAHHPETRHSDGLNGISIGFTSHYAAMRQQFGTHLFDGCAGENILVETRQEQEEEQVAHGIVIQSSSTGQLIYLKDIMVAAPCVEFSHFALGDDPAYTTPESLKAALQFLDNGRRGFYATLAAPAEATIQAGDMVFVLEPGEKSDIEEER